MSPNQSYHETKISLSIVNDPTETGPSNRRLIRRSGRNELNKQSLSDCYASRRLVHDKPVVQRSFYEKFIFFVLMKIE